MAYYDQNGKIIFRYKTGGKKVSEIFSIYPTSPKILKNLAESYDQQLIYKIGDY